MKPGIAISEEIERELLSWPDVTVRQHPFGGREFRVGNREIGHLHGSALADLPFPRAIRDELVSSGKVSPHRHVPDSGWISFRLHGEEDIPFALALFRRNYERIHALVQRDHASAHKSAGQDPRSAGCLQHSSPASLRYKTKTNHENNH
jgi:hypothetical protein